MTKMPKWLFLFVLSLVVLGCIGVGFKLFTDNEILSDIANFSLILTLAAVLVYVYYTYLIAKEAWTPSASFSLVADPRDKYHVIFILNNHSKLSLNCWCNLNTIVEGEKVSLGGFYSGESSFDLQPFGSANGHFYIKDILAKANKTIEEMNRKISPDTIKKLLYMNIEFWYNSIGSRHFVRNPRQPHYFNFSAGVMVADF